MCLGGSGGKLDDRYLSVGGRWGTALSSSDGSRSGEGSLSGGFSSVIDLPARKMSATDYRSCPVPHLVFFCDGPFRIALLKSIVRKPLSEHTCAKSATDGVDRLARFARALASL